MSLGEKLFALRKQAGYSQETVAEKVGVTRQTISKWENNQALPEMIKGKLLAELYGVTYDSLANEATGHHSTRAALDPAPDVDWTNAMNKRYPVLADYHEDPKFQILRNQVFALYDDIQKEMGLSELDTFLVMRDMVSQRYRQYTRNRGK
ncbi:helix-turn-helix transcriptional regulator [Schleiferilactobacillus shenzhenensis]|nr:helix-turn-helix transcriptional regulator [Schleiferilactobacillus shenzhenensis]